MAPIKITLAGIGDFDVLKRIGIQTFTETFASVNTEENMALYLEKNFSPDKLGSEINDKNSAFYIARNEDDQAIGYLKLNFNQAQTELQDKDAIEIERIYALKEYHGKKVGQQLFEKACTVARERAAQYIWLAVWEENERAIAFYEKNGFVAFSKHLFTLGTDVQTDIMMKLLL